MNLEQAKKNLNDFAGIQIVESLDFFKMRTEDIKEILRSLETVLQALDSSIPIQVVEEKIKEYERRKEGLNDIEASVRLDVKIRAYKELLKESK